jgi:hypothetical protein
LSAGARAPWSSGSGGVNADSSRPAHSLTIGDGAKDPVVTSHIMGYEIPTMAGVYQKTIADERLWAVADHVHAWGCSADRASGGLTAAIGGR